MENKCRSCEDCVEKRNPALGPQHGLSSVRPVQALPVGKVNIAVAGKGNVIVGHQRQRTISAGGSRLRGCLGLTAPPSDRLRDSVSAQTRTRPDPKGR